MLNYLFLDQDPLFQDFTAQPSLSTQTLPYQMLINLHLPAYYVHNGNFSCCIFFIPAQARTTLMAESDDKILSATFRPFILGQ